MLKVKTFPTPREKEIVEYFSQPSRLYRLYLRLLKKYGDPVKFWPHWCAKKKNQEIREMIAIGAILTQRTSWKNVDLALGNLKKNRLLSLEKIAGIRDLDYLADLIRPAGFFRKKPLRLRDFAVFVINESGGLENLMKKDLSIVREKLLNLPGIGPETADSILLYSLDKPSFVIDEYTRRFVAREKISRNLSYDYLKRVFETSLPKETKIYQRYHALIVIDQQKFKYLAGQQEKRLPYRFDGELR